MCRSHSRAELGQRRGMEGPGLDALRRPVRRAALSSPAAFSVKVTARNMLGREGAGATWTAIRWVTVVVLPVPAPARIATGPRVARAASRWAGLSPVTIRSTASTPAALPRTADTAFGGKAATLMGMTTALTIGELRAAGYPDHTREGGAPPEPARDVSRAGEAAFPGVVGFDERVVPALERGILAGHDLILLGERGQAKTRLIRAIVELLDASIPAIAGCEINDHPFRPICARCRALVAEQGDAVQIVWIPREDRYAEKLATPDTAVADLIGDVDPIKVAEGRYLADELTIHYGMIPRTNRGIVRSTSCRTCPSGSR